jgi:Tol biopolymer transport system component
MMKNRIHFGFLFVLAILCLLGACSPSEPEPAGPEVVPLDGRGGGVIAYSLWPTGNGIPQIYAVNADGSGNVQLSHAAFGLNHLDWSASLQRFVLVGYVNMESTWSIYTMNGDGSQLTRLTDAEGVWDSEPAWSPDGSRIAFTRNDPQTLHHELWIMNADGSGQRAIGMQGFQSKWSPDGSLFLYTSNKSGNWEIYTCRIDGSNELQLTRTPETEATAIWSPQNGQIVFSTNRDGNNEIYIMAGDGTDWRRLTNSAANDYSPRFSGDGSLIAFQSDLSESKVEIYVMNADGSNPRPVTNTSGGTASFPCWRNPR